jgi:hypothetical protein
MFTCPLPSNKIWKQLVEIHGENKAKTIWIAYKGEIPSKFLTVVNAPSRVSTNVSVEQPAVVQESSYEEASKKADLKQPIVEIFEGFWNRQQVALQTDKVFLFGDNTNDRTITKYVPSATQAVIRGLSNAIGIDTKKDRGTSSSSYLTDNDFEWFKNHVDEQIQKAKDSGKTIVIPADGIGTGKAMLKEKAPKLFEYLQQKLNELKNTQITPEQQAQQLYSQYLEQNPNGNIEGFKEFVNSFNKTNLEQQSENKSIQQIYKENTYLEEFINSVTNDNDNISIYNVKEMLDKHGEGRIVKLNKILYNAINRLWDNNIFAKNNLKIKFVDSLPENAIGNFNKDNNEITIDKRKFLNNVISEDKSYPIFYLGYILNHEIIHYLTPKDLSLKIEYVDRALNGKFGDTFRLEHEREFGKNIKELYDIAIKELDNVEDYGFLNLAEFVAEAMSNTSFQEKLASIPFKSSKESLWKRFVKILSAYLSLDTKKPITNTLLEGVIAETTNYITENSNIQRTYKRRKTGKIENIDIGYDFMFTTQKNIGSLSDFISQKSQDFQSFQQSLNKPNTNPILQGNQQEQAKKFTELQERLSNKEFLEGAKNAFESSEELQNVYYEAAGFSKQINEIADTKKVDEFIKKYKEALPNIKDGKTLISHLQTISNRNTGTTKQFADLIIKLSQQNKSLEKLLNNPNLYAKPDGVGDEGAFHWSLFNNLSVNKIVLELDHFKTNTYDDVFLHELIHNLTTQFIVKDSNLFNQDFYNKVKELYSVFDNHLENNRKVNEPLLKSTKEDIKNIKRVIEYFNFLPSDAIQQELIFGKIGSISTIKNVKLDFKSLENKSKKDVLQELNILLGYKENRVEEIEKGDKDYYYFNSKTFKQENVLSEFLATFMNNAEFREQLKNIDYKNNKSLFQKIVDLVGDFLGLTKNESLYNEFILNLTKFINNNDYSSVAKQTIKTAYENRINLLEQQKQDALNAYTDYIARVSLGIIKNPSSGEYNYESKVKDIVYHGSTSANLLIEGFKKEFLGSNTNAESAKLGFFFSTNKSTTENYFEDQRIVDYKKELEKLKDGYDKFMLLLKEYPNLSINQHAYIRGDRDISEANKLLEFDEKLTKEYINDRINYEKIIIEKLEQLPDKNIIVSTNRDFKNPDIVTTIGYHSAEKELIRAKKDLLYYSNNYLNNGITTETLIMLKDNYEKYAKDYIIIGDEINLIDQKSNQLLAKSIKEQFGENLVLQPKTLGTDANIYNVLLNIKTPKIIDQKGKRYRGDFVEYINEAKLEDKDGVIVNNTIDPFNTNVLIAFEPEQIHILSSKADVEGFKEFINKNKKVDSRFSTAQLSDLLKPMYQGLVKLNNGDQLKTQNELLFGPKVTFVKSFTNELGEDVGLYYLNNETNPIFSSMNGNLKKSLEGLKVDFEKNINSTLKINSENEEKAVILSPKIDEFYNNLSKEEQEKLGNIEELYNELFYPLSDEEFIDMLKCKL